MSEHLYEEDAPEDEPDRELVQWMQPRPLTVGARGLTGAVVAAFALGAVTAVGVMALTHALAPPWRRGYDL